VLKTYLVWFGDSRCRGVLIRATNRAEAKALFAALNETVVSAYIHVSQREVSPC
jgi:hypothetical protein